MRALVLEDSNYSAALSAVRALGRLGHEVVVAAPWETPAACSRWCCEHVTSPSPSAPARYADFALSLFREGRYDIALACDDPIIQIISRIRDDLPQRTDCLLPPQASLDLARSKLASAHFAASVGVPAPRTAAAPTMGDVEAAAREWGFPLVLKRDHGAGGTHVRYAANWDELARAYAEVSAARGADDVIVQEFVPGDVYLTQVLYDHGRLVAICSHRKERQFPLAGGVTARGVTVREAALDAQVAKIFSALRWHGPAKADFKRDPHDGSFKLMELDPRLSATVGIARAAGVDIIAMCCELARRGTVAPRLEYRVGTKVRYVARDLLCVAAQPRLMPQILADALDWRVRSDFDWRDLRGGWGLLRRGAWAFDDVRRRAGDARRASGESSPEHRLFNIAVDLVAGGLRVARAVYRTGKAAGRCARGVVNPPAIGTLAHPAWKGWYRRRT